MEYTRDQLGNKTFNDLQGARLESASRHDWPDPYRRVLHFQAMSVCRAALKRGWITEMPADLTDYLSDFGEKAAMQRFWESVRNG